MKANVRNISTAATLCAAIAFLLLLAHCVADETPPVIVTDGGTVVEEASVIDTRYSVSGTVDGLPATATVTLTLNGADGLTAKNGAFAFPSHLLSGQTYVVAAGQVTQGYSCATTNGSGTVASANVTGVIVHCTSADATLSALVLSTGTLAPAFAAQTLMYTASVRVPALFPSVMFPATTITATANDPGATITVGGVAATSGKPSAPITVKGGANMIDVLVTASDGKSQKHYTIAATGTASDYFKASNTLDHTNYGWSVALSGDGNTLAVGSITERSAATGINGDQTSTAAAGSGAVYVYRRTGGTWAQEAYVKPSNTASGQFFGVAVALSTDGNTLAVGNQAENAYVFTRAGTTWSQQSMLAASNPKPSQFFGRTLALSGDGNTLVATATGESSAATGIGGDQTDTTAAGAGAAYVFLRTGTTWAQQAYVKASNTRANAAFGGTVALSSDGSTLAVGSASESSNATTINGNQADTSAAGAGAVYVFTRAVATWSQQAYVKAANTRANAAFGAVALSSDGNTLAVGAPGESSAAVTINGDQNDTTRPGNGAAYVFKRNVTTWSQDTYVKPSSVGLNFGGTIALSADGNTLAVGQPNDSSNAVGVNGNANDASAGGSGAAFVFTHGTMWSQLAYVKPSNTRVTSPPMQFGQSIALSGDGKAFAAGATGEDSAAKGVNGNEAADLSFQKSGAAYVY